MRSTDTYRAFEADLDAAEAAAKAMLSAKPAEAHYYLGATLGFRARANAGQKRFFRALPDAVSALRHLKKALALDPALSDARLGLGMYHYFAARMPAGAKPLARLLVGEGADRKTRPGRAVERGPVERDRAHGGAVDAVGDPLQGRRGRLGRRRAPARRAHGPLSAQSDLPTAPRLRRRAPRRLRRGPRARRSDGKWFASLHPSVRSPARAWALYAPRMPPPAGPRADTARWLAELETATHPKGLKDWILLRRANFLDSLGKNAEADALYDRVKDKTPAALAARFKKDRYPGGPKDAAPFFTGY